MTIAQAIAILKLFSSSTRLAGIDSVTFIGEQVQFHQLRSISHILNHRTPPPQFIEEPSSVQN